MAKETQKPAEAARIRASVIERRLQNPFGEPSAPIAFKDRGKVARWFNGAIITDKIWRAKNKGWTPVLPKDVADLDQIGGYNIDPAGGHITRGERGQEVLMWMWQEDYDAVQMAKTRENNRNMGNPSKQRSEALEAFGQSNADGAEFVDRQGRRSGPVGGVFDQYERIERRPEVED